VKKCEGFLKKTEGVEVGHNAFFFFTLFCGGKPEHVEDFGLALVKQEEV